MTVRGALALTAALIGCAALTAGPALFSAAQPAPAGRPLPLSRGVPSLVCPGPETLLVPPSGQPAPPGGDVQVTAVAGGSGEGPGGGPAPRAQLFERSGSRVLEAFGGVLASVTDVLPARGPAVLVARQPPGASRSLLAAAQTTVARSGDLRGLTASTCLPVEQSSWLVGGATGSGHRLRLLLANPGAVPAVVDLDVRGPGGPVAAPSGDGIQVPARRETAIYVDALTPGLDATAVHVTARSGRVRASLHDSVVHDSVRRGVVPGGVDEIPPVAPQAKQQVIPGVSLAAGAPAAVRVVVPGTRDAVVSVTLIGPEGAAGDPVVTGVPAGAVADVPVGEGTTASGDYAAVVHADVPVLAAAVVGRGSATAGGPADYGWAPAAEPLAGQSLLAMPAGADRVLVFAAAGQAGTVLVRQPVGGARLGGERLVHVPAGSTVRLAVDPGLAAVWLGRGSGGPVSAALVATVDDDAGQLISVLTVPPGSVDLARPLAVQDDRLGS